MPTNHHEKPESRDEINSESPEVTKPAGTPEITVSILLVDDREDKRLAMKTIIEGPGRDVVAVSSGREALRCLLNNDFAAILLDVNMPGMDGFETAHLIRQRKNSEYTPIIFVTGISDTETHVSRGYSLGAVDYILTPVLPEVLRTKIAVFVELFRKNELLKRQAERLRRAHEELEERVKERTAQLAAANEALQAEVAERLRVEEKIRRINGDLEQRVLDRTAELALANEELEAFSYSVAHDLQAPLRNIESYAQMLEEDFPGAFPPVAQQYLDRIGARSRHLAQLVTDLLNFSRLGKKAVNCDKVDLNKLANGTIAAITSDIHDRKIDWQLGELGFFLCDANLINQVFMNLISNAVKFTQTREKAVIEIGRTESGGEAAFYVRDNGVGFDMRFADKLFGVFQRLHPSGTFDGTGIGLATAARIVRKHGGRIWADAQENRGATFYFTLGRGAAVPPVPDPACVK